MDVNTKKRKQDVADGLQLEETNKKEPIDQRDITIAQLRQQNMELRNLLVAKAEDLREEFMEEVRGFFRTTDTDRYCDYRDRFSDNWKKDKVLARLYLKGKDEAYRGRG